MSAKDIGLELRIHAPFTLFGTLTGVVIAAVLLHLDVSRGISASLFDTLHPLHVLLSALATAGMLRRHGGAGLARTLGIGWLGAVGIATLSDCIIPYLGEWMLHLPDRGLHLGFLERPWLVNPLALLGGLLAYLRPLTVFPHAGHVLLSTWASLFHMSMALGNAIDAVTLVLVAAFLFLAVWIPCCTSDIVFPLLFARSRP